MKQAKYGLILLLFLMVPPVIELSESIMSIHMHMQMPLLGIAGMLMVPYFKEKFPRFFEKWNANGIPGILLFMIIIIYWLFPRTMDEALTVPYVEVFKFISWPFLAGVPLRDSWGKLSERAKGIFLIVIGIIYTGMGFLYLFAEDQLCNNYLVVEQRALGWGFLFIALSILLYYAQDKLIDHSKYE